MLKLLSDHNGLRASLGSIGYEDENFVGAAVGVMLLLDQAQLTQEQKDVLLNLLTSEGQKKLGDYNKEPQEWGEFDYGNVKVGDYVRVKLDAYDSPSGSRHNGLVGTLTAMRSGVCSVQYLGLATGNAMKHPKEKLESLRKGVK